MRNRICDLLFVQSVLLYLTRLDKHPLILFANVGCVCPGFAYISSLC